MQFTNDDLGRLVAADRGLLSGGAITKDNYVEDWTLGQTGNWAVHQVDLNGDGDLTDTGELDEDNPLGGASPHFNKANELIARDLDGDGPTTTRRPSTRSATSSTTGGTTSTSTTPSGGWWR